MTSFGFPWMGFHLCFRDLEIYSNPSAFPASVDLEVQREAASLVKEPGQEVGSDLEKCSKSQKTSKKHHLNSVVLLDISKLPKVF